MKMEHIICSNPSEFDATLSKALEVDKPCFVLFTGAKNKETGKSWCPDCVAAEPIISDKLGSLDVTLIECPVVREEYRQPTYSYRVHDKVLSLYIFIASIITLNFLLDKIKMCSYIT
jgi:hypothetical protein